MVRYTKKTKKVSGEMKDRNNGIKRKRKESGNKTLQVNGFTLSCAKYTKSTVYDHTQMRKMGGVKGERRHRVA